MLKTQIVKSSKLCLLEKLILQKLSFVDIKFGRLKFWKIFITRKYNHTNFEKFAIILESNEKKLLIEIIISNYSFGLI